MARRFRKLRYEKNTMARGQYNVVRVRHSEPDFLRLITDVLINWVSTLMYVREEAQCQQTMSCTSSS